MKWNRLWTGILAGILLLGTARSAQAQQRGSDTLRVLFIGNSYTYFNALPNMLANMAASVGQKLIHDASTPGGYSLMQHTTNATTLQLIQRGNWDYVVLQDQSQWPSMPEADVEFYVYPAARKLDSIIHIYNPCAKTVFYMTWGRKNGDAGNCSFWPPVCTYKGMDDLLQQRYTKMAQDNKAIIAPVAKVWRQIREKASYIDLYSPDESHPSAAGTYAAACAFYSVLFENTPMSSRFNSTLSPDDAASIRLLASGVAFDSLSRWRAFLPSVKSNFTGHFLSRDTVAFTNSSKNASHYRWDFGDGHTDTAANPVHVYAAAGKYIVTLTALHCGEKNVFRDTLTILADTITPPKDTGTFVQQPTRSSRNTITLTPNPVERMLHVSIPFEKPKEIEIADLTGKIVMRLSYPAAQEPLRIDAGQLPSGMYILHVVTDHSRHSARFIRR